MHRVLRYIDKNRSRALIAADVVLLFVTTTVLQGYAFGFGIETPRATLAKLAIPIFIAISAVLVVATMSFYRWDFWLDRRSWALRAIAASLVVAVLLLGALFGFDDNPVEAGSRVGQMGFYIPLATAFVVGAYPLLSGSRLRHRRVFLLGQGHRATNVEELAARSGGALTIAGRLLPGDTDAGECPYEHLPARLLVRDRIDEVVIAVDDQRGLPMQLLMQWKLSGLPVTDYLTFWERECGRVDLAAAHPAWFVFGTGCRRSQLFEAAKRAFDISISLSLIVLTSPVIVLCAALIWLESGGPVLYRQERVGRNGQSFSLLKFRSMRADAEIAGRPQWAGESDPRVTRVGALIRRLRIDEIPQLWNVLRNDMSIIGPRPERPFFVEQLAQQIPFYKDRHCVKPGITGWAQVNFPYGASVSDARQKLSYDLYYVKNASLFLDLFIALSTIRVILLQEGAR